MRDVPKNPTMADVRRYFGIEIETCDRLAQFGGMQPFLKMMTEADIKRRLSEVVGQDGARVILQLVVAIICGAADMEEVERVGNDPAIAPYLGRPLSATRIPRVLAKLKPSEIEKLHEFVVSLSLLDLATFYKEGGFLDIEADATAIEKHGHQEGVEHGYVEEETIAPCYQYLLFRLHQTNAFFYGTLRAGAAHSQNGFGDYLRRFLPIFKEAQWRPRLRVDSGFYSDELIDECTANKAFVYVKAPMSDTRKLQAQSPLLVWTADNKDKNVSWATYETTTAKGAIYREVFKRTEVTDPGELFPYFRYDCVITNDMETEAPTVFAQYNGRANIENSIKELKYDYKLGCIVTQSFAVNDVITQATLMAHVLIQHFKRLILDKKDQNIQLSTMRWRVLSLPTLVVRGARRRWYRLRNAFMDGKYFTRMLRRLAFSTSFLLRPPDVLVF